MNRRMLSIAIGVLLAAPVTARAQQPRQPMPPHAQAMMMCPMMGDMQGMMGMGEGRMGGQAPGAMGDSMMMSQMRSQLGVGDAQMQQMETARQHACAAAQPEMNMAMQAHQAAMQKLMGDSPDLEAYRAQLKEAADHMVAAQVEMARGMLEMRKTLSPEQRQKWDRMHQEMMQHGPMPGMSPDSTAGHAPQHPGGVR